MRLLVIAVLLAAGCGSNAPQPLVSQPRYVGTLNPAVTQQAIATTVCRTGWTATIRPSVAWTNALKRKQLPAGANPSAYEEDHRMPLELGGAPKDPANLTPILWKRARADDVWETRLHREVCSGTITLAQARAKISDVKHGE